MAFGISAHESNMIKDFAFKLTPFCFEYDQNESSMDSKASLSTEVIAIKSALRRRMRSMLEQLEVSSVFGIRGLVSSKSHVMTCST